MRLLVYAIYLLAALVAIRILLRARADARRARAPARDPGAPTADLRARLLHGTSTQFGVAPVAGIWGVLVEVGYPQVAATVVALGDGTASLYLSAGGGAIGGGQHPSIQAAARRLVALAGRHAAGMTPVREFPLPGPGEVTFYLLTDAGVRRGGAAERALEAGDHPLSELFFAGHEIITGLREVSETSGR